MDSQSSNSTTMDHQQAMLDACSSGDQRTLQNLLKLAGVTRDTVLGRSAIDDLLTRATTSKQAEIVTFLLQTYPSLSLSQNFPVVQVVLDNPDADTLRALCAHDQNFASFSIDYAFRCFITEACSRPPEAIVPVLHVLLDNNADVNDGFGPGGGALYAAILGSQPLEIIDRIVRNGAIVGSRVIYIAIEKERLDVLEVLFRCPQVDNVVKSDDGLITHVKNTSNGKVIALVESFAQNKLPKTTKPGGRGRMKKWWKVWRSWR